jgi:hypothetical protein
MLSDSGRNLSEEMLRLEIALMKEARACIEELNFDDDDEFKHETPPDTEFEYRNDEDVREMMDLGERLANTPWGENAYSNRMYYIAGIGHQVAVKPLFEDQPISPRKMQAMQRFLQTFMTENQWSLRQAEVAKRNDIYGESIDILLFDNDGMVRTQFGESEDLVEDPESEFNGIINNKDEERKPYRDEFGVRRTNDLRYQKTQYYLGEEWHSDLSRVVRAGVIDEESLRNTRETAILMRTRNLLNVDNRGRTLFFPIRSELVYAKRILANVMRVSSFQAAFGAIRTLVGGTGSDQMKMWQQQQENVSAGSNNDLMNVPAPGVITKTANVNYEFPDTGKGLINHMEILTGLLRVCSTGIKMPEFMLTSNVSEANFSSTLVSEGPFHKGMQFEQHQMVEEDKRILHAALIWAAKSRKFGFLLSDVQKIRLEIKGPRVQTRNRKEDFEVNNKLNDKGLLSNKTLTTSENHDFDSEQAQRQTEQGSEIPLPIGSEIAIKASQPGPVEGGKADPMKEPGVSKGVPKTAE